VSVTFGGFEVVVVGQETDHNMVGLPVAEVSVA
jgi:hypothetical protein